MADAIAKALIVLFIIIIVATLVPAVNQTITGWLVAVFGSGANNVTITTP